ncbi:hypothetical protein BGX33_012067 [Mortierella sp. NVP41]|nr:hypothetical protein BGX33_012067 [Mortierella sp. NVP41]
MPFTILALVATGSIGVVAAPLVVTAAIGALGFGAGGIAAGSWAAGFMASYGGTVASGSACAVLQSVGSAGLSTTGTLLASVVGGSAGAAAGAIASVLAV